ncbi:MAG TPA: pirin family protein, partial [Acidimicrobiales bacterium]|nr:pirin family protein [Acidimicrobiales bacterium]
MEDPVLQLVQLDEQRWPTVDPFLNCVHHVDTYPEGNEAMGPDAPLDGRDIGSDFAGIDGWRMYHGDTVPGFPAHPHRGFETVTYVRSGLIDHADSLGATARYGRGDVQWLTAGRGIQHAEMFPLVERDAPNPMELFQIWVNLPGSHKLVDPTFTMFADRDVPRVVTGADADEARTTVTVIAGAFDGTDALAPPPDSWAADPASDLAIWHLVFEPGASVTLPGARSRETLRTLYVFDHGSLTIAGHPDTIGFDTAVAVHPEHAVELHSDDGTEVLVLAGVPIGEPVASYGPFVMNTREEIAATIDEYQRTRFGGWPWPSDSPVHPRSEGRFARHADGRFEDL